MDDVGNLVYIVFLVIYFLSRAFKKKKPAPPKGPVQSDQAEPIDEAPTTQKPGRPLTFEELLREFTEDKVEEEPEPAPVQEEGDEAAYDDEDISKKYQESIEQAKSLEGIYPSSLLNTEDSKFGEFEQYAPKQESSYGDFIRNSLQNPEDLKKAIILKEVLDRKF